MSIFNKCIKCNGFKRISLFPENKNTCKSCISIYQNKYRKINRNNLLDNMRLYGKKYYLDNKEAINLNHKKHYNANKEKVAEKGKIYRKENKTYWAAKNKAWVKNNRDKTAEYGRKWIKNNKNKVKAKGARRRASQFNATPLWANKKAIESLYALSSFLTLTTFGNGYHVDHAVPLKSKHVCGLHCEDNLQILRAEDNQSKGNRYWPDMWLSLNN